MSENLVIDVKTSVLVGVVMERSGEEIAMTYLQRTERKS
jgi:hypothetical protein